MTIPIRLLLLAALLVTASSFAAGPTYKWVDAEGRMHYSDRPHPGAEEIELPTAQTFESQKAQRPALTNPGSVRKAPPTAVSYESVTIVSPTGDEVLWNLEGELSARVSTRPALRPGHAFRWFYDGKPLQGIAEIEAGVTIPEVWRGTHTLLVAIVDGDGKEVSRSRAVTFHVRQNSVN